MQNLARGISQKKQRQNVIALHCSAGNASHWDALRNDLDGSFEVRTPEHFGCGKADPWHGADAICLTEEAKQTVEFIDEADVPVHLIGHSYGGAVALQAALMRPQKIASLIVFEPTQVGLLDQEKPAWGEIADFFDEICNHLRSGNRFAAAQVFVDYWNGEGAFSKLCGQKQQYFSNWISNAPLNFHAARTAEVTIADLQALCIPTLVLKGDQPREPIKEIVSVLRDALPQVQVCTIMGGGHMAPITHPQIINREIELHITQAANAIRSAA